MKKAIIVLVAIMTTSMATAHTSPTENECRETYNEIKALLDKQLITIEQAQRMWYDWERKKHKN